MRFSSPGCNSPPTTQQLPQYQMPHATTAYELLQHPIRD
jgi:hypothetical protein